MSARPVALPCCRLAEPFEALRDASDRHKERNGAGGRPKIFLAKLGRPADFTEPAAFAKNLFEAGGIGAVSNDAVSNDAVVSNEVLATPAAMIAAFKASGAALACLCATPAVYAAHAADVATALRAAGARHVYLAGRPDEADGAGGASWADGRAEGLAEEPRAAGVGTFVHAGCDALEILRSAHAAVGVS